MTVFTMFFVELCISHHKPSGTDQDRGFHSGGGRDPALGLMKGRDQENEAELGTTGKRYTFEAIPLSHDSQEQPC